jgi:hypothetical protein
MAAAHWDGTVIYGFVMRLGFQEDLILVPRLRIYGAIPPSPIRLLDGLLSYVDMFS